MDRREGEGKIFCTFSSLEAFNEDRLTRSLTKELVAEREKVILIIIIAVCVQSYGYVFFFFVILLRNCPYNTVSDAFRLLSGSFRT